MLQLLQLVRSRAGASVPPMRRQTVKAIRRIHKGVTETEPSDEEAFLPLIIHHINHSFNKID